MPESEKSFRESPVRHSQFGQWEPWSLRELAFERSQKHLATDDLTDFTMYEKQDSFSTNSDLRKSQFGQQEPWSLRGLNMEQSNKALSFSGNSQAFSIKEEEVEEEQNNQRKVIIVDGHEVLYELQKNVTQKSDTDRRDRIRKKLINANAPKASFDTRFRRWLMKFDLVWLSIWHLILLMVLNITFTMLHYIVGDRCCDDPAMTFAQVFDFTFQTISTIGYGGYLPEGLYANSLVVISTFLGVLLNAIFAGLIFVKFVNPVARIEFSDVMVVCNLNGVPCLQVRIGNLDGYDNLLTDAEARLSYVHTITYQDEDGKEQLFEQRRELALIESHRDELAEVWTIRHLLDEKSPLFGLDFSKHPGNSIRSFGLRVKCTSEISNTSVSDHTFYELQDMLIGHRFIEQETFYEVSKTPQTTICDYAKMNETVPQPVWYPVKN